MVPEIFPFRAPSGLEPGDIAPACVFTDDSGVEIALHADALAGHAFVLAFCRSADDPADRALLAALAAARLPVRVLAVTAVGVKENAAARAAQGLPFALLADVAGAARKAWGLAAGGKSMLAVVDHNRRIAALPRDEDPQARVAAAASNLAALAARRVPARLGEHPPVLVLPRVLSAGECAALIEVWHRPVKRWHSDGFRSAGFDKEQGDFKVRVDSYGKTDQFVIRDPDVLAHLDGRMPRRVLPQFRKAFQQNGAYREEFRIACYDAAEGGSLPAHRDNPTPATRHRVFTMSIHLNAGEYEGGGLRFPEYGDQVYEVERGTAVVWSCSLLHAVDPVTRGRRFILGTHFFNDLAAMQAATKVGAAPR